MRFCVVCVRLKSTLLRFVTFRNLVDLCVQLKFDFSGKPGLTAALVRIGHGGGSPSEQKVRAKGEKGTYPPGLGFWGSRATAGKVETTTLNFYQTHKNPKPFPPAKQSFPNHHHQNPKT